MSTRDANDLARPFQLDPEQVTKLGAWLDQHDHTCGLARYAGAAGGRLSITFTPTSLGIITVAQCACAKGSTVDLTDYDAF